MRSNSKRFLAAVVLLISFASADAQDRAEYNRRGVARYLELFQSLDRDGDGTVTRAEAEGDLNFTPPFNDMDINRDGIVTKAELDRFLELEYGMRPGAG
jgi:Ca2+-binding EF-hand superfamily protein